MNCNVKPGYSLKCYYIVSNKWASINHLYFLVIKQIKTNTNILYEKYKLKIRWQKYILLLVSIPFLIILGELNALLQVIWWFHDQ